MKVDFRNAEDFIGYAGCRGYRVTKAAANTLISYMEGHGYELMYDTAKRIMVRRDLEADPALEMSYMPYSISEAVYFCIEMNDSFLEEENSKETPDNQKLMQLKQDLTNFFSICTTEHREHMIAKASRIAAVLDAEGFIDTQLFSFEAEKEHDAYLTYLTDKFIESDSDLSFEEYIETALVAEYGGELPPKGEGRDNLLVTLGCRAGQMEWSENINLPSGVEGEEQLAQFAAAVVDRYISEDSDASFDEYIELALEKEYGKKKDERPQ